LVSRMQKDWAILVER
jgi:hypothetical protein